MVGDTSLPPFGASILVLRDFIRRCGVTSGSSRTETIWGLISERDTTLSNSRTASVDHIWMRKWSSWFIVSSENDGGEDLPERIFEFLTALLLLKHNKDEFSCHAYWNRETTDAMTAIYHPISVLFISFHPQNVPQRQPTKMRSNRHWHNTFQNTIT